MSTWTESQEAVIAEQSWNRIEQERHQRLLYQLKVELRTMRQQGRSPVLTTTAPGTAGLPIPKPVPAREERLPGI